jgi:succinate dehydrogenase/fumarate reductase cytochrome b subunit
MKTVVLQRATSVALAIFLLMPVLVGAEPFADAGNQAKSFAMTLLTPVAGLVIIVIGALCFAGRIAWGYLAAVFVGFGLIFGHEQIVTMFRSWAGA